MELKDFYFIKVIIGVLLPFIVASTGYWIYYHVDLLAIFSATLDFIIDIPIYLLNSKLLIKAIHRWLNNMVLGYVVALMTIIWTNTQEILINNPIVGAFIIILGIAGVILLFVVGSWLREWLSAATESWKDISAQVAQISQEQSPPARVRKSTRLE